MRIRSIGVMVAVLSGSIVLLPESAAAAPPFLISASHQEGHPTATWSLPSGVEAGVVEIAISPQRASDGYFFSENVEIFDILEDHQTSYLSAEALQPGTYYLHVSGYDFSCDSCPIPEWSQTMTITIPNLVPRISKSEFDLYWALGEIGVQMTVCDEGGDDLKIHIEARRLFRGRTLAKRSSSESSYALSQECDSHSTYLDLSRRFYGVGKLKARAWVTDPYGAASEAATDSWRIGRG